MTHINSDTLSDLLLLGNKPSIYIPNRGNAGDSLIGEATFQFFDRIGMSYSISSLDAHLIKPGRVVIAGGGNLVPPYRNIRNFLETNFDEFREVIILPHTIRGHEDLLSRLDKRFTLICREQRSFEFCTKHAPRANVLIADDMAFHWNEHETRARARVEKFRNLGDFRFHVRNIKHTIRHLQHRRKISHGTLDAFRTDIEKNPGPNLSTSIDVSQIFATDSVTRPYSSCAVDAMMQFLAPVERVRTDRLHIAILSAMLGKTVEMFDNNYGKNRSVYEFSLAKAFPNVAFVN